jgi:hypothetical protein
MFCVPIKSAAWIDCPVLSKDGVDLQAIKVQGVTEDFQFNAYGFPLNDIAALNGAKSLQEYNMILQRLQTYAADNPDYSNLTTKELIETIVPRSFQTPAELSRAADWIGRRMDDDFNAKVSEIRVKRQAEIDAAAAKKLAAAPPKVEVTTTT